MTESSAAAVYHDNSNFVLDSCGLKFFGTDLIIDKPDETGQGEVCFRGRHIMMGYLKNEEANKQTIDSKGFLHSGDVGTIDSKGYMRITGRIKEMIITAGGENIIPAHIEDVFKHEC